MEPHSGRPHHILIVDDSDDIRQMWCWWLTYCGFTVEEARNGAEAVAKAKARRPDLILMDLGMPVLDGLAATAQLRGVPNMVGVPVLGVSANPDPPTPELARAAGCDVFIAKPISPDELLEYVRAAFSGNSRTAIH